MNNLPALGGSRTLFIITPIRSIRNPGRFGIGCEFTDRSRTENAMVERRLPEGYSNSIISAAQSKNPNLLFAAVEKAVSFLAKTEGHLKGMEFTYDLPRGKIFMKGKFPSGESYACSLVVESTIPCLVVRGKIGFEVSFSSEKLAFPNKVVRAIEESVLNFDKLVAEGAGKP